MAQTITGLLAAIVLIASLVAVYLVTKSQRVEKSIETLGSLVDTLTKGNADLRAEASYREQQHQLERVADKNACDNALAAERAARQLETLACQREISMMQGKVDALTTNIAEVIATAVLRTIDHASSAESTTVAMTVTKPATGEL